MSRDTARTIAVKANSIGGTARAAARSEFAAVGLAHGGFGLLAVLGLLIVDAEVRRVDCSAAGTWLWLIAFAVGLLSGLAMMWRSRTVR